ncbi:hypothetical protein ONE63_010362 [Megalurothrips usitatus]|uniref:Uncharacterized protein n=1 Tax=Megalurothrips usitatus TaxID=439358 RepID=A0AAV7XQ55_9NEOP|nr:hypothetical protein ONE63_010362 [Megalurothrips usitatus]
MTTAATRLAASVDVPAGAAKADRAVRDAAVHSVSGAAYGGEDRTAQDHVDGQAAGGHDGVSECSSWCGCGECSADGSVPLDLPADPQTTFGDVRVHNTSGGTVQVGNSQTINIHTAPAGGADIVLMVPHAAGAPLRGRTPKGRLLLLSTAVPEPPAEKAAAGFSRPKRCLLWAGVLCAVLTSSSALVSMLTSIASNGELVGLRLFFPPSCYRIQ